MIACQGLGARQPGMDDVVEFGRTQVERLRRICCPGARQSLDETIEAVRFFVDDLEQLVLPFARQRRPSPPGSRADQRGDGRLDRGERRPQIVRQRIQQRRLHLLAAPRRLGLAGAIEGHLKFLVQPRAFLPAHLRLGRAPFRARGQLAPDDRHDDERGQRHPVVGISELQTGWRDEVVREPEGGEQRRDNRRSGAAEPRVEQQHEQEDLRGIRAVHAVADEFEHRDRERDRPNRREVLADRAHPPIIECAAGGRRYAFLMFHDVKASTGAPYLVPATAPS